MGYYPRGNKYFSDLLHYVRSGEFVAALIDESTDINQYAFALGALAHYSSDNMGHPVVNHIVAIEFPKLARQIRDFGHLRRRSQSAHPHRVWVRHGAGGEEPLHL